MNLRTDNLDATHILLDAKGWASDNPQAQNPFCFQSLDALLESGLLYGGTPAEPVTLYIAPGVYWLHDPERDNTALSYNDKGMPCEKIVRFDWLKITGLSEDPGQVVFAARKGQAFGCVGNYTMFSFEGKGLWVQNLTFGNYCNVDLEYPGEPTLSRPKRSDTITQAQLASFNGEELWAENCRFVSRLNLMPISGAVQSVYRNCHFESTDDALNDHAVYEECDFDFYGGCPLWGATGAGVIFRNCLFRVYTKELKFVKHGGQLACMECRFESAEPLPQLSCSTVKKDLMIYELDNTWNGEPFSLNRLGLRVISLENLTQLKKAFFHWEENEPVSLKIGSFPSNLAYEDGPLKLHATVTAFSGAEITDQIVSFEACPQANGSAGYGQQAFTLQSTDKQTCILQNRNEGVEAVNLTILAHTDTGLTDEITLTLLPRLRQAPHFKVPPFLQKEDGYLKVKYQLDIPSEQDNSLIVWYRLPDNRTDEALSEKEFYVDGPEYGEGIAVAGGRGVDCACYRPDMDDAEHWLYARVTPAGRHSKTGVAYETETWKIASADILCPGKKETDFRFLPLEHKKGRGIFLFNEFTPAVQEMPPEWRKGGSSLPAHPWNYGSLGGGCTGSGIYPIQQGSSILYEPSATAGQDMQAEVIVDPAKTAGQGFGGAGQYMDILLRFDPERRSGAGVRIIRTTQASDGVAFVLVRYSGGVSDYLTEPVTVSCFQTGCRILAETRGTRLHAEISCTTPQNDAQKRKGWTHEASLDAILPPFHMTQASDTSNAFCLIHTGTCGDKGWLNTILLHRVQITYFAPISNERESLPVFT